MQCFRNVAFCPKYKQNNCHWKPSILYWMPPFSDVLFWLRWRRFFLGRTLSRAKSKQEESELCINQSWPLVHLFSIHPQLVHPKKPNFFLLPKHIKSRPNPLIKNLLRVFKTALHKLTPSFPTKGRRRRRRMLWPRVLPSWDRRKKKKLNYSQVNLTRAWWLSAR